MDQEVTQQQNIFNLELNIDSKFALQSIAKWCKFFAILGFVFIGLMCLFSLAMMIMGGTLFNNALSQAGGGLYSGLGSGFGYLFGFAYLVFSAIYFVPCLWLYQFSTKCKSALISNDSNLLGTSLNHLRRHYKFMGIIAIIFISLYGLIFVFGIIAALIASLN